MALEPPSQTTKVPIYAQAFLSQLEKIYVLEHAVLKPNDYLSVLSKKYVLEKIIKDANQLKLMQLSTTLSKFFSVLCDCDS